MESFVAICLHCLKNKSTKLWCNLEAVFPLAVVDLVGMYQSSIAHLRKDIGGKIERQREGRPKFLQTRIGIIG